MSRKLKIKMLVRHQVVMSGRQQEADMSPGKRARQGATVSKGAGSPAGEGGLTWVKREQINGQQQHLIRREMEESREDHVPGTKMGYFKEERMVIRPSVEQGARTDGHVDCTDPDDTRR